MCKYRDANEYGNHFRILNARMVQSVDCPEVLYAHIRLLKSQNVKSPAEKFMLAFHFTCHVFPLKAENP